MESTAQSAAHSFAVTRAVMRQEYDAAERHYDAAYQLLLKTVGQ